MLAKQVAWLRRSTILVMVIIAGLVLSLFAIPTVEVGAMGNSKTPVPAGQRGDWELIFSDDFDGSRLDSNKWVTCYWWDKDGCTNRGNNELQWYRPENVIVADGVLKLVAQKQQVNASDGRIYNYTSGMVTTGRVVDDQAIPTRFSFQYGYAEIRARLPVGKGLWPAFWTLPTAHYSKPEIDILEYLGHETNQVHLTYHFKRPDGRTDRSNTDFIGPDFQSSWHTYAVDWSPQAIVWYVDGVERWRFEQEENIAAEPMYLLLNLAVGGDWPGSPDEKTVFPSEYWIDYVRVWKKSGNVSLMPVENQMVDYADPSQKIEVKAQLVVDGDPARLTVMKFDLGSLNKRIYTQAWLRIKTVTDPGAGSPNTQLVYLLTEDEWQRLDLARVAQALAAKKPAGTLALTDPNVTYDLSLDVDQLQSYAGSHVMVVMLSQGDDGLYFYSRQEASVYPRLVIKAERYKLGVPFNKDWNHALNY